MDDLYQLKDYGSETETGKFWINCSEMEFHFRAFCLYSVNGGYLRKEEGALMNRGTFFMERRG